jgi:hypothetical protein
VSDMQLVVFLYVLIGLPALLLTAALNGWL